MIVRYQEIRTPVKRERKKILVFFIATHRKRRIQLNSVTFFAKKLDQFIMRSAVKMSDQTWLGRRSPQFVQQYVGGQNCEDTLIGKADQLRYQSTSE